MSTDANSLMQVVLETTTAEIRRLLRVCRSQTCKPSDLERLLELTRPDVPSNLDGPLLVEVVDVYCKHLESITLDPPSRKPDSLAKRLKFAFIALDGLGVLALTISPELKPTVTSAIARDWQKLVIWTQYFGNEVTDAGLPSIGKNLSKSISVLATIIAVFGRDNEPLFNKALLKDEAFFKIILKMWWKSDKREDTVPSIPCTAFHMVCRSSRYLISQPRHQAFPTSPASSSHMALQDTILHELNGDAQGLAKRVIEYVTNTAHKEEPGQEHAFALSTLNFIGNLILDDDGLLVESKFTIAFMQMQLGLHAMRHVGMVVLPDADRDVPSMEKGFGEVMTSCCFGLMAYSAEVPGALHWLSVLLDNDFFGLIAGLVRHSYLIESMQGIITNFLKIYIPKLLVHREFVITTIEALRTAMEDGSSNRINSSVLKDTWRTFVRSVLERTIYNALYERSCVEHFFEKKRCEVCKRVEENCENGLRKCANCAVPVYCSRECQKAHWKSGHRRECESLKGTAESAGETLKYGQNNFVNRLAKIDIRRHAPGLKNIIREDELLKDSPRRDIVIVISYMEYPPTIKLLHISAPAAKDIDGESSIHEKMKEDEMIMHVMSSRGGPLTHFLTSAESTNLLDGPTKHEGGEPVVLTEDETSTIAVWSRISCQSEDGKDLQFELDEIDACLLDAYRNYRPDANEVHSPDALTLIDYLEDKIDEDELVPEVNYINI